MVFVAEGYDTGSRSIYLLLLIYGASTVTTLLPCLTVLFTTPATAATVTEKKVLSLSDIQRLTLLSSYIPFLLIPLTMTLDMAQRIYGLMQAGMRAQGRIKTQ
jgi:hypothetical protein